MVAIDSGWAERSGSLGRERAAAARSGRNRIERPALAAISNEVELEECVRAVGTGADADEANQGQVVRASINDLQHRLLLLDPQADVYDLALEKVMKAAGADRVCAFLKGADGDGRKQFGLHAEAVVSPELSLIGSGSGESEAFETFAPGLLERLAAGGPFGGMTEFLPGRTAAARLAGQGVEAILLLPLFVGGLFCGVLRLDRCDRAKLWSEDEIGMLLSAAGSISAAIERQQVVAEVVRRSHELASLLTTSRAITSSIDYDIVLREVACAAAEALGCSQCVIWEYSGRSDVATYRVCYQRHPKPGAEDLIGETLWASDYPGGMRAVREGVVTEQSLSDEDLSSQDRARMTERGERTRLSVPLVYREELLGMMILVETEHERSFKPDEARMARVIGEQAAASLHNARLHRREEDQHRWLAALSDATRVIGSRLNRVELLRDVAGLATKALLVDKALIYEWDEHDGGFALRATDNGLATGDDLNDADAWIADPVSAALRRGEYVVRQRADEGLAPRAAAGVTGEQAVAWVPFRMNSEILGAMRLSARSGERMFGEDELSFACALGEHAAIALNNAHLYAQIEDAAMTDGLTGLANHRRFYDRLAEEIDRARRCGASVALVMLDIDDFKKLNDTYGHPAGDEVLRLMGELMKEECRKGGDLAARYGGEEFCVILPDTSARQAPRGGADALRAEAGSGGVDQDAEGAAAADGQRERAAVVAERLRRRIAATPFPVGPDHAAVTVTVSIGIAAFPGAAKGMDELVACADAALYAAKRAGKNRVNAH